MIEIPQDGKYHGIGEGIEAKVAGGCLMVHFGSRTIVWDGEIVRGKKVFFKAGYLGQPGERCWDVREFIKEVTEE